MYGAVLNNPDIRIFKSLLEPLALPYIVTEHTTRKSKLVIVYLIYSLSYSLTPQGNTFLYMYLSLIYIRML